MPFTYTQTVLFQHCDPAGIVFYPRYFEMLNATVETWFAERLGHSFAMLHGPMQGAVPTARLEATFSAPSRLGEVLAITLRLTRLGRSSAGVTVAVASGGQERVGMTATLVYVGAQTLRPQPWPDSLRRALEGDLETAPP